MRPISLLALIVAALPFQAFAASHMSLQATIDARADALEAAIDAGDGTAAAALYTEDALLLPNDMDRVETRAGAEALWTGLIDAGVTNLRLTSVAVEELTDDIAMEDGVWTAKAPDGNGGMIDIGGKYVVVWKKSDDGEWYLHWDIWNDSPME
ncbi:YybH family protein [Mameliella sp.]|uniref:YybH family protein n=1 Tax=Mameliella sp. TaxID=1924940 RepID=UPI003BA949E7